ncbi:hypothetical protein NQ317_014936 [Molorchus minor]|uniref:THAP-type domain-containing protein n=1 Tax=Molorchus minor TaxID=1323400 RepID=A0ABQ9JYR8_9CUCU|nr:hypothetical protein NQ317_014936 [Molorchus minor]
MAIKCLICKAASKKGKNRSFHRFPKCMERRRKWVKALAIENLPRNTFVCSDHFTPGDFTTKPSGVLWLRKEVVPRPLTNLPAIETRHTLESFPQGKKDTKPYSQAYNFPHTLHNLSLTHSLLENYQKKSKSYKPVLLNACLILAYERNEPLVIDTGSVKIEDVEITEDFPGPSSPNSSTSTLTANSPMSVGPEELRVIPSPLPNQNFPVLYYRIITTKLTLPTAVVNFLALQGEVATLPPRFSSLKKNIGSR